MCVQHPINVHVGDWARFQKRVDFCALGAGVGHESSSPRWFSVFGGMAR
jgi:hypothetical protein